MSTLARNSEAVELNRKADLCRRAARVPTSGGHHADRLLLALAERLEREAKTTETPAQAKSPSNRFRR